LTISEVERTMVQWYTVHKGLQSHQYVIINIFTSVLLFFTRNKKHIIRTSEHAY
jgi:hypothetical protein